MSHMIDMSNNEENMAYVGATPWHKLGTQFVGNETFEEWRIAAGFAWEAQAKELSYKATHAAGHEVDVVLPSHKALIRSDLETVLSVVSKDYKIVQPKQVLEFFRDIAFASDGAYTMETAGCLFDGRKIWALARTKNQITIGGVDIIKPFVLFGTSFDLSQSTYASHTLVRVVCHNTMSASVGADGERADVKITHAQTYDENAVKFALGLLAESEETTLKQFAETADRLSQRVVGDKDMFTFFADLYGPKKEEGETVEDLRIADFTNSQKRNIDQLILLFKKGPGSDLPTAAGTTWGLVNAVTHFEDHSRGKSDVKRLQSSAFGAGKNRKKLAVRNALALAA